VSGRWAWGLWRSTVLNMIRGAHVVLCSTNAEADRAFFRDVLDYPFVDAGRGWLILALPPAELAIHPANANGGQELFLMCDDVEEFIEQMSESGVACSDLQTERWGVITHITLPGGGALGVYEPTHPSPLNPGYPQLRDVHGASSGSLQSPEQAHRQRSESPTAMPEGPWSGKVCPRLTSAVSVGSHILCSEHLPFLSMRCVRSFLGWSSHILRVRVYLLSAL